MRSTIILLIGVIFISNSCKKNNQSGNHYFKCKVDGQEYIPDACTNCIQVVLLRDTIFILGGNHGYETVGIGINNASNIKVGSYALNEIIGRRGDYKNNPSTDRFYTDATHTGSLQITLLDKQQKIISGTFSFQAFNTNQNKTVNITNGEFRLNYTTN